MILPERAKALRLIIDLVNRGEHGGAVATANGLKDILGVPVRQRVEAVTRNEGFYQLALRDKLTGVGEVLAFGPDGSAWEWGRGGWVLLPLIIPWRPWGISRKHDRRLNGSGPACSPLFGS